MHRTVQISDGSLVRSNISVMIAEDGTVQLDPLISEGILEDLELFDAALCKDKIFALPQHKCA